MASRSLRSRRPPKVDATPTTTAGDHPETDAQSLGDESDDYVQSLHDDSDVDVQQLEDESDEDILPARQPTRKSALRPVQKPAHKNKRAKPADAQQQIDDGDNYKPPPGVTTSGVKRVARNDINLEGKKRRTRHNRRAIQTMVSNNNTKDTQAEVDVGMTEQLRLISTPETRNLNAWLHALKEPPGLKVKLEVRPTELTITHSGVTPLGELPDAPNRDFKALVKIKDVTVTFDPQGDQSRSQYSYRNKDTITKAIDGWVKVIPTWEIRLWNDAQQPNEEEREYTYIFPEMAHSLTKMNAKGAFVPHPYKYWVMGGPLDINVCPSESEAKRVAQEACRLLNKLPFHIDAVDFPEFQPIWRTSVPKVRQMLELMSMSVLRDGKFDFRDLRPIFQSDSVSHFAYCISPVVNPLYRSYEGAIPYVGWEFIAPTFIQNSAGNTRESAWLRMLLRGDEETYPSGFLNDLPDVPPWWGIRPITPLEEVIPPESKMPVSRMMRLVNHICEEFFGYIGSSANFQQAARDLARPDRDSSSRLTNRAGPLSGRPLFVVSRLLGKVSVSQWLRAAIEGTVPDFYSSLPSFALAMALQRAYEMYISNRGILRTVTELGISLDELSHSKKQILSLQTYCSCGTNPAHRSKAAHYCMICLKLQTCSAMGWHDDGRLICLSHFLSPLSADSRIAGRVRQQALRAFEDGLSLPQRHAMSDYLVKNCVFGASYDDIYFARRTFEAGTGRMLRESIDAINPLYKDRNGSYFVHHVENVGLTAEFYNRLKHTDIPLALGLLGEAMRACETGNEEQLRKIECAYDHCARIRNVIPYTKESRMREAAKTPNNWFLEYDSMMEKGLYNLSFDKKSLCAYKWRAWKLVRPTHTEESDIRRLNQLFETIQADKTINPSGIPFLRGKSFNGLPGAPWLWNPEHMFHDYDWEFLAAQMEHRLRGVDEKCDFFSDHEDESWQTLCLTCVVLFFKLNGGKGEWIGVYMTIFSRHPLRWSVGRRDEPGVKMFTGWKNKYPTSLDQYDDSIRTITTEPWIINRGKTNYPTDSHSTQLQIQALREIPSKNKHWDVLTVYRGLRKLDWPKSYKTTRVSKKAAAFSKGADDENEEEEEEEEEAAASLLEGPNEDNNEGLNVEGPNEDNNEGLNVEGSASKPLSRSQFDEDTKFVNAHQDEAHISGDTLARIRDILKRWGPCLDGYLPSATPAGPQHPSGPPGGPPPTPPNVGKGHGGFDISKYAQEEHDEGTQTGLFNGGNTCYQNALFQAFAKTPAFTNMLRDMPKEKLEKLTSAERNFKNLVLAVADGELKTSVNCLQQFWIDIDHIAAVPSSNPLWQKFSRMNCVQQDPAELFALLSDKFCQDILEVFRPIELYRNVRCKICSAMRVVGHDRQCPIAVSIPSGLNSNLKLESLLQFGEFQPIDAGNEVNSLCSCHLTKKGEQEDAVFPQSFPNRMIVQIKRFMFVDDGSPTGWVAKNQEEVLYPMDKLKVDGGALGKQGYRVQTVVCHDGTGTDSGHYYALCRDTNLPNTEWTEHNDKRKIKVRDRTTIVRREAYMIFLEIDQGDYEFPDTHRPGDVDMMDSELNSDGNGDADGNILIPDSDVATPDIAVPDSDLVIPDSQDEEDEGGKDDGGQGGGEKVIQDSEDEGSNYEP
ncbi:hypothetical protein HBH56_005590 [Parastagonospora nodorum]|uniref:USP domain-containing protein n=1 Tax=Phaeosphaeria nodorum (strain SN15 / ATCC MYA-4574 / FGSC 10173) TaxID=321614 RepID=A0A7U2EP60_PHANO|nr:hypothetical protein HBH56_005590 [Parastagonospora nodorum]QRC90428.1 hypothetical protein JI435_098370 [Parastagonospora nodorum SN15]KAH3938061.1 hypothetical protein HBH54_005580 [Parastagonospora nodorum]KAH3946647.1 hypothetical protein HBH53_126390 [Parastagonospora nodorum]KAH3975181.1 hypothetical protein HBH51_088310 [Parastagonospora nodorum]